MTTALHTAELTLEQADSRRLTLLCGPFDDNLKHIERRLLVDISHRDNQIKISGPEDNVAAAVDVLEQLFNATAAVNAELTPEQVHLLISQNYDIQYQQDGEQRDFSLKTKKGLIKPRNPNQAAYVGNVLTHDVCFGIGPAGTGKTYLAVACAVDALERNLVRRIILTRPAVEAGEKLGFLPGDLAQKVDPYLRPLYDALFEMLGFEKVEKYLERGIIEIAPLAYMRGRTLNDAFIILDESQNIKNPSSKSFKAVKALKSKHKLILSGTPVENTVNDLWTQMSFINPGLLGTQAFFQTDFVQPIEKKKDEEKAQKLQVLIKPFVMRRTKEQVATELPPKTENLFYSEMSQQQADIYEKVKSEYRNELLKGLETGEFKQSPIQMLQGLTKLRQIANHPYMVDDTYEGDSGKFEDVIHKLQSVVEAGHKVLVFSQFVKQLDLYRKYFEANNIKYSYLDGATSNRGKVVEEFKAEKELQIFLISIKAGGVGLNLTEADYVFILDPWWNPAVEQQAIDRTHRIGQTKNIFAYRMICTDTVEDKILKLQDRKRSLARELITDDEGFVKSLTREDVEYLFS